MSKPIKIEWKEFNKQAVCLPQTTALGGENLIINGDEAILNSDNPYFSYVNLERTISLSSDGDLSLDNFTVYGTLRGLPISEGPFAGPNNGTIETIGFFTTVTAIVSESALADNVSVGTGTEGHTIWIRSDYHRSVNNLTVAAEVVDGALTYTFDTTLDDPSISNDPAHDSDEIFIFHPIDGVTIPTIPASTDMIDATASSTACYPWPTHSSRFRVSASDADSQLFFYFLQQGQV